MSSVTEEIEDTSYWTKELDEKQKGFVKYILDNYPSVDRMMAETLVRIPEDRLHEIVEKHKAGAYGEREPAPGGVLKTGYVSEATS